MDAASWIDLVQLLPADLHDGLGVVMQNGLELNLQSILRLEEKFLVCKGRMTGSTEGGITFFLPYDQITLLAYPKPLKDDTIHSWFKETPAQAPGAVPALAETFLEPAEAEPSLEPLVPASTAAAKPGLPPARSVPAKPAAAAAAPTTTNSVLSGLALPAKAAMIERLRKRAQAVTRGSTGSAQGTTPKPPPEPK